VKVSIPQSVWWMRMISWVPADGEGADLVVGDDAAGVADDVGLALGDASGQYTSRRASMQASTATCLAGGRGSGPV